MKGKFWASAFCALTVACSAPPSNNGSSNNTNANSDGKGDQCENQGSQDRVSAAPSRSAFGRRHWPGVNRFAVQIPLLPQACPNSDAALS